MPIKLPKPFRKPTASSDSVATSPAQAPLKRIDQPVSHSLKVSRNLFDRMEEVVAAQPVKMSRNTWILQAIYEKIERDKT